MTYGDRLKRWAVVRLLPHMQRVTIARFMRESDADGYVKLLRRLEPHAKLVVIFDPVTRDEDNNNELPD